MCRGTPGAGVQYACRLGKRKDKLHIKMKITYKTAMSGSAQSHLYDERGHDFSPAAGPTACVLLLGP